MKGVTREKARVDRIACPWLISRFIAIPYDVPDVELGHQTAFDDLAIRGVTKGDSP